MWSESEKELLERLRGNTLTAQDIAAMPMEVYKQYREKLLTASYQGAPLYEQEYDDGEWSDNEAWDTIHGVLPGHVQEPDGPPANQEHGALWTSPSGAIYVYRSVNNTWHTLEPQVPCMWCGDLVLSERIDAHEAECA